MNAKVYETLKKLQLSSNETREIYSVGTRDNPDVKVWRDKLSGVIFIDDYFVGDQEYSSGAYRARPSSIVKALDLEDHRDTTRRVENYRQFYQDLCICDFGCGEGTFIRKVRSSSRGVTGVELQESSIENLRSDGIVCHRNIDSVPDNTFDTIFAFHVLEHLADPLEMLRTLKSKLKSGGNLIIEVPSATDFLLSKSVDLESFKQFTLWSQHLILHTRQSLDRMLNFAGLRVSSIEGVQRYPVSNHMNWLRNGQPGGHKSFFSVLDSPLLCAK